MKFTRFFLLIPVLIFGCKFTQSVSESTCKFYQTGNFILNEYNDSGLGHWKKMFFLINRTDTTQTIISTITGLPNDTTYYLVKWLTPCNYELTYKSGTNSWVDSLIKSKALPERKRYFILKGNAKYYIQRQDDQKDTIWVR